MTVHSEPAIVQLGHPNGNALFGDSTAIEPTIRSTRCGFRKVSALEPRWKHRVEDTVTGLLSDGETLLAGCGANLYCFDLETGAEFWSASLSNLTGPPISDDGGVFAATWSGLIFCLDRKTGIERWAVRCSGDPIAIATSHGPDRPVFVGQTDGGIVALEKGNGGQLWHRELAVGSAMAHPLPFGGEHVVFGLGDGTIHDFDQSTGETRWRVDTESAWIPTLALEGANVVARTGAGSLLTVDLEDGSVIAEVDLGLPRGGAQHTAPVVCDEFVLVACSLLDKERQEIVALDPQSHGHRWTYRSRYCGRPVAVGDAVYFTTRHAITAVSAADGTELWSCDYTTVTSTTIAAANGRLIAGGTDHNEIHPMGEHYLFAF